MSGYHSKIQSSNIIITDDDDDTKNDDFSNDAIGITDTKKPSPTSHHVPPSSTAVPSFARKVKVIAFILGCCCLIAIIVNFINLHSDFEELQEFYIGYMGRKVLIQEQRLTSRTYLNLLRKAQREGIEVSTAHSRNSHDDGEFLPCFRLSNTKIKNSFKCFCFEINFYATEKLYQHQR